ncbi:MAG: RNA-binding domain-containing protein [Nanobdellota archaeon]
MIAHSVRIEVFSSDEEKDNVVDAIVSLLSDSCVNELEKGNLSIDEEIMKAQRPEESEISILRLYLTKKRLTAEFINKLFSELKETNLEDKLCSRVDDGCKCYIRLDKKSMLKGSYKLTYSGDCFHIKISFAAYPAKKEKAKQLIADLLNEIEKESKEH